MFNLTSPVVGETARSAVVPLGNTSLPSSKSITPSALAVVPLSLVIAFLSVPVTTSLLAE